MLQSDRSTLFRRDHRTRDLDRNLICSVDFPMQNGHWCLEKEQSERIEEGSTVSMGYNINK